MVPLNPVGTATTNAAGTVTVAVAAAVVCGTPLKSKNACVRDNVYTPGLGSGVIV
jgi:hypothetical protein